MQLTDSRLVREFGFRFLGVPAGKWRRYFDLHNLIDIFVTLVGFIVSLFVVLIFWPNKVFIKGGYVGIPVGLAAAILRRPIILHESDSVMGIANRILARLANRICVSFPLNSYQLPVSIKKKMIYTGVPVNEAFYSKELGSLDMPLKENKPLVLIIGGSQGARIINQTVKKALPQILEKYQVVHLSGSLDYSILKNNLNQFDNSNYYLFDFLPNIQIALLMKRSAVIVSRAGATAIAEIAAVGKPAILIPLKGSANNHQCRNADYLSQIEAAIIIEQDNLTPQLLVDSIDKIVQSDLNKRLSFNISSLMQKDATTKITKILLDKT